MTAPRKQLGYANVESKERFPHSHSPHGCGILQRQTKNDVYTKDWTLPGERVGLLPHDDRYYTVYFAQFPIALLDSRELKIVPLSKNTVSLGDEAGEEEVSPSPAPHPLNQTKVSGMSSV
jgi:hypothetical protein